MKPVQNWVKSEASQLSRSFVITTQKIGYLGEANQIRIGFQASDFRLLIHQAVNKPLDFYHLLYYLRLIRLCIFEIIYFHFGALAFFLCSSQQNVGIIRFISFLQILKMWSNMHYNNDSELALISYLVELSNLILNPNVSIFESAHGFVVKRNYSMVF